ncbi:hypothetical protein EYF80_033796 [Liparis tanakae]|uniref:Uncharacterized protein n=1 Tax=Liparis tanakae TaxID=230148 RepID=A0A4Z2GRM8_9TELE|nr:hypothetical protein EYF80_033796 [Liparis tanakae]
MWRTSSRRHDFIIAAAQTTVGQESLPCSSVLERGTQPAVHSASHQHARQQSRARPWNSTANYTEVEENKMYF